MASQITLEKEGSYVLIRCRSLPIERFKVYREAIEGVRFIRAKRSYLAPMDKVPTILRRLREAGFPVTVEPELIRALQEHTAQQWLDLKSAQERATKIDAELKTRGLSLYPFQRTGASWLSTRTSALLSDEMGLGKTIQAIIALPAAVPVLVIAPAVAKGVWLRELSKWRPQLPVRVLKGRDSFRWPEPGEVLVTNYDILPEIHAKTCPGTLPAEKCKGCKTDVHRGMRIRVEGHRDSCNEKGNLLDARECPGCAKFLKLARPDTCALLDEIHAMKSSKARRTKRWRAMRDSVLGVDGRLWGISATPMLNQPAELWNVYQAVGAAEEAFGSWGGFVELFRGKSLFFGGYEWGTPEAEVAERIRRVALRRMRVEVLPDLPEKTHRELVVDIDRKALVACDKYLEEIGGLEELIALIEKDGLKFETMSRVRSALATAKTPAMLALLKEFEDAEEPVVVFSAHRLPIDLLKKRPGWRVITGDTLPAERTLIEEAFQAGKLKGVGCTIKAGGVAITLTRAHQSIFVDREFTPALNSQAEDRICRIGQTKGCIITILVADHQLDIRLAELLTRKQLLITQSVDAARVIETPTAELDREQEEHILQAQEEVRQGRVARHFAVSEEEKRAFQQLFKLIPTMNDRRLVAQLAEESETIGLSNAQWELAIKVCKRYPEEAAEKAS